MLVSELEKNADRMISKASSNSSMPVWDSFKSVPQTGWDRGASGANQNFAYQLAAKIGEHQQ